MLPGPFTELLTEFIELNTLRDNSGDDGRYFTVRDDRFFGSDKIYNNRLAELRDELDRRVDGAA